MTWYKKRWYPPKVVRETTPEKSMHDLLQSAMKSIEKNASSGDRSIVNYIKYQQISDDFMNDHTHGVKLIYRDKSRVLLVYADSPLAVSELRMNTARYMARVRVLFGNSWIDDMEFRVSRYTRSKLKEKQRLKLQANEEQVSEEKTPPRELTPRERNQVKNVVRDIKDEKLKMSIKKAYISYLRSL